MLNQYIDNMKETIISKTQELIQIPSVYEKSSDPLMPFGKNINAALQYILQLGNSLGFRTKNIDGYCGYIEFGQGDELIGIIGHLDVVPVGQDWTFPPFSATITNGKIYGRGAIDDKGPVIASLFAMKAVMKYINVKKRVRLILGLNEELSWKCINYYKAHEEIPSIGFSPDADFPCIYAEKSLLSAYYTMHYQQKDAISIIEIDCNENAINVVPKFCSIKLQIDQNIININEVISFLQSQITQHKFKITTEKFSDTELLLTSRGVSAHAAHPDLGINAISQLLLILNQLFCQYHISNSFITYFGQTIGTEYDGKSLNLNITDESGALTLNVGNLSLKNNILKLGINFRIPVQTSINTVKQQLQNSILKYPDIQLDFTDSKTKLYIPKDHTLVQTLCKIYNQFTNSNLEPIAIGGATFARAFPNCISFGANFPGDKDMCHQVDEYIEINKLILACKIYAKAIETLSQS